MKRDEPDGLLPQGHLVIFGVTRSGKTSLIRSLLRARSRVLVADPHGEYGSDCVAVHSPDELIAYLNQTRGSWRIAYSNDHLEEDFPALCRTAYQLGSLLYIVDEADWWCSPTDIEPEYAHLIKYGLGHAGPNPPTSSVQVASISRFPAEVHRVITSQASAVFSFHVNEPRHVQYIAQWAGRRFAEDLPTLPMLEGRALYRWEPERPILQLRVDPATLQVEAKALDSHKGEDVESS